MKGSKKAFSSGKTLITVLLIIVQIAWIILLLQQVTQISEWVSGFVQLISLIMAIYIVGKDDVAAYRMGWVILIIIAPVIGGFLYLIWGDKRSSVFLHKKLDKGKDGIGNYVNQDEQIMKSFRDKMPRSSGTAKYLSDCGFPVWQKTIVKYHSIGEYQFADMIEELKKAKNFIFMEYFIIREGHMWNTILDILREKASTGVDVRLIYDDFGCLTNLPHDYDKKLGKMGSKAIRFNTIIPVVAIAMNNRDHRKLMIIDGNVAFTGGLNLADEYINRWVCFGHWKDSGLMLKGEAVFNFTLMFLEMWNAFRPGELEGLETYMPNEKYPSEGFIQPFYDSPFDNETISVNLYIDLITRAKDYIYIFTPYLIIGDEMTNSLRMAAKRGVDVRIVIPGIPDKKITYRLTRSFSTPLIESGIRVYEYSPGFLHSKSYVIDDETAIVGTINTDYRSLYLHFECGVLMSNCEEVLDVRDDALRTFEVSHEVTMEERTKKTFFALLGRGFDAILKIFAPLF